MTQKQHFYTNVMLTVIAVALIALVVLMVTSSACACS